MCFISNSLKFRQLPLWIIAGLLTFVACSKKNPTGSNPSIFDFSLEDLNPNSPTYQQLIGPSTYQGEVSGYYFANQG